MNTYRFLPAHPFPIVLLLAAAMAFCARALAHCDAIDGPVVKAGRRALEERNVNWALIWVQKSGEPEIVRVFEHALAVRKLGAEAREARRPLLL